LEAVAAKQRKTTYGGCSLKKTVASTEATDPQEALLLEYNRTGALSISSCISKNTGSLTAITREKLAQLYALQQ